MKGSKSVCWTSAGNYLEWKPSDPAKVAYPVPVYQKIHGAFPLVRPLLDQQRNGQLQRSKDLDRGQAASARINSLSSRVKKCQAMLQELQTARSDMLKIKLKEGHERAKSRQARKKHKASLSPPQIEINMHTPDTRTTESPLGTPIQNKYLNCISPFQKSAPSLPPCKIRKVHFSPELSTKSTRESFHNTNGSSQRSGHQRTLSDSQHSSAFSKSHKHNPLRSSLFYKKTCFACTATKEPPTIKSPIFTPLYATRRNSLQKLVDPGKREPSPQQHSPVSSPYNKYSRTPPLTAAMSRLPPLEQKRILQMPLESNEYVPYLERKLAEASLRMVKVIETPVKIKSPRKAW